MTRAPLFAAACALACGLVATLLAANACAGTDSGGGNPLCTCASDELYESADKSCVKPADFVAPAAGACTDDGSAVCGCDDQGYTSQCAAEAVGVEVQYAGACHAGGGGGGFDFGW